MSFQIGHKINLGRKHSEEARDNMSLAQIGNKKSLGFKHSKEESLRRSEFFKAHPHSGMFKKGTKKTQEVKLKISATLKDRFKNKENTPNWKGGISFEEYSPLFNRQLKDRIRVRDNFICQLCGVPELEFTRRLDIHHKDYNKKNNDLDNLISLCQRCHLKTNFNREYWLKEFAPETKKAY